MSLAKLDNLRRLLEEEEKIVLELVARLLGEVEKREPSILSAMHDAIDLPGRVVRKVAFGTSDVQQVAESMQLASGITRKLRPGDVVTKPNSSRVMLVWDAGQTTGTQHVRIGPPIESQAHMNGMVGSGLW